MKLRNLGLDERTLSLGIMASSIILGISCPPLSRALEPVALPSLFLVVVFSLMPFASLPTSDLLDIDKGVWRILLLQQIVLPAFVIAFGVLATLPDYVISFTIVTACSGALFAAPALAALLDLDRRASLQCMVLSTLSMPISLIAYLSLFHSTNIHLDLSTYAFRVAVFLLIPFLAFAAMRVPLRRLAPDARASAESYARWAVIAALAVFGIGMMRSVSEALISDPVQVLFFALLAWFLCIAMLIVTTLVLYRFGLRSALTASLLCGLRNVGLGYALVGDMLGSRLAVYVGVSLLPVFLAPLLLRLIAEARQTHGAHAIVPEPRH